MNLFVSGAVHAVTVTDADNASVLDQINTLTDTAVGFALIYLPKKLLIPPNGFLFQGSTDPINAQAVQCRSLEDALAIL